MNSTEKSTESSIELIDDESHSEDSDQQNQSSRPRSSAESVSSTGTTATAAASKRQKEMPPCFVCGAKANGYNFDQITCESCKAFFRRNALKPKEKFRCRNNNNCPITTTTRKRCKRCRLSKCFQVGMRKEWILSEEEKIIKRQKIQQNRLIKKQQAELISQQQRTSGMGTNNERVQAHDSASRSNFQHIDCQLIQSPLIEMYSPADQRLYPMQRNLLGQLSNGYKTLTRTYPQPIKFVYRKSEIAEIFDAEEKLRLIKDLTRELTQMTTIRLLHFFNLIPEFNLLHGEEQKFVLTQNMLIVFMFHGALTYNPEEDTFVDRATNDQPYDAKYLLYVYGSKIYTTFIDLARRMTAVTFESPNEKHPDEHAHTLFLLLMTILLFSSDFQSHSTEFHQINPSKLKEKLSKVQHFYIDTALRFIHERFGFTKGKRIFQKLLPLLGELQKLCSTLANVNLCESAEDEDSSTDSLTNRYESSMVIDSSPEFNSSMISERSHLNELQKENRAPPPASVSSTTTNPFSSNHRTSPAVLSNVSQSSSISSTTTGNYSYPW